MNARFCTLIVGAIALAACVASPDAAELRASAGGAARDAGAAAPEAVADEVEIVRGVPDRNRDPAVIALAIGTEGLCTGTLISPRIVLTARHCVSRTVEGVMCPAPSVQVLGDRDPKTLEVLVGDDIDSAYPVARGVSIIAPGGVTLCDADIALVVLDVAVKNVKALPIRSKGVTRGDRVRAVGFGKHADGAGAGIKLVREHVRVLAVTHAEFTVGEATCQGDSGGPAIDEDTGEIVGVVSRGGPSCEGPSVHNIYTRVDAFSWLVDEAFAQVSGLGRPGDADAGPPTPTARGSKQKPPSDVGGPCEKGADCAAGVCLTDADHQYCSRPCGSGDRCPARYNCRLVSAGSSACVNVR